MLEPIFFNNSAAAIKKHKHAKGGFPSQYIGDPHRGVWCSAAVLQLHRFYPFMSEGEVSSLLQYVVSSFCRLKKKGERNEYKYGWGSFSDPSDKSPITCVTATVLMGVCGLHTLNPKLKMMFELATIWIVKSQHSGGYWENTEDHYTNMLVIEALTEVLHYSSRIGSPYLLKAIKGCLATAKDFYENLDISTVDKERIPFCLVINKFLGIAVDYEEVIKSLDDDVVMHVYKAPNSIHGKENFSFYKPSGIYYIYLASIDDLFYEIYADKVNELVCSVANNRDNNCFWVWDAAGVKDSCLWLTADYLRILFLFYRSRVSKDYEGLYLGSVQSALETPLRFKIVMFCKTIWKYRKPLKSIYKEGENWLKDN